MSSGTTLWMYKRLWVCRVAARCCIKALRSSFGDPMSKITASCDGQVSSLIAGVGNRLKAVHWPLRRCHIVAKCCFDCKGSSLISVRGGAFASHFLQPSDVLNQRFFGKSKNDCSTFSKEQKKGCLTSGVENTGLLLRQLSVRL